MCCHCGWFIDNQVTIMWWCLIKSMVYMVSETVASLVSKDVEGTALHLFEGTILIWHSEDRASWYIPTIKANEMHYFSNLVW